jgi:inorganic pyrophosphatase
MDSRKYLGKPVKVIIDRPLGSIHPKHSDIIYKLNYGYIPETVSGDFEELDAYILGVEKPISLNLSFEGVCIAIIRRLKENDDKLIVAPYGFNFNDEEIRSLVSFQEQFFEFEIQR